MAYRLRFDDADREIRPRLGAKRSVRVEWVNLESDDENDCTVYECHFSWDSAPDFHPQWCADYLDPRPPSKKVEDEVWAEAFDKIAKEDASAYEAMVGY